MKDMHAISLKVNGREHELVVEARRTLADMLRHDLGYTGTHLGCEHGICGANAVRDALGLAGGVGQLPLTPARVCALAALAQPTGGPVTGGRA